MAFLHRITLCILATILLYVVRVSAAVINSSASAPDPVWWHTLPRAIVPIGPMTIKDLPTKLLVDTLAPLDDPSWPARPARPTGRNGAKYGAYENPYTSLTDKSLASQCGSSWSDEFSNYLATGSLTSYASELVYANYWFHTPKLPCCGGCNIGAISAELIYWPTPAPTPAVSTFVDDVGFTLYALAFPHSSLLLWDSFSV